jgi:undecaprenyl-diphosphatase
MTQRTRNANIHLAAAIGALALVMVLGALQAKSGIFDGADAAAIHTALTLRTPALTFFMRVITAMGDETGLMVVVCAVFWLGYSTEAIVFLLLLLFGNVVNERFKDFFELARPSEDRIAWLSHADGYGYPSGHTQNGMFYSWLVYAFVKKCRYLCLIPVFLLAASRIYLGVHFFSDTAGGFLSGLGVVGVGLAIIGYSRDLGLFRDAIKRSLALKIACSLALSTTYLFFAWGLDPAFKYAGFLAGFFIAYSTIGFRWRSRNALLAPVVVVVGLAILMGVRGGLKAVLPPHDASDYLRYLLSGGFMGISPLLFVKVGLLARVVESGPAE